ncbi:MAG: DUF1385 domain-containing protein [Anaerolineaceae bacterium]|nr:DUF1385 domain-containing protein [Anaerolineaceae bacterium]
MTTKDLKLPAYGGQALIEGVLMRGKKALAAAMRSPEGEIIIVTEELKGIYQTNLRSIPLLRGLILLWDALVLGIQYLTKSANVQTGDDEKIEGPELLGSLLVSFALSIGLFFVLPAFLSELTETFWNWSPWASNLFEGVIRLFFIIIYMWGIGKMKEIDRVFAYHGSEHKVINAYEAGIDLTPENISKCSREHPRCGTSFILTLVIFSIIIFALIGPLPMLWRIATRILLIPIITGIAYEYTKWVSNHLDSKVIRFIIRPNMALQQLTTREPDYEILEVGIAAFNAMLKLENELLEKAL